MSKVVPFPFGPCFYTLTAGNTVTSDSLMLTTVNGSNEPTTWLLVNKAMTTLIIPLRVIITL